MSEFLVDLMESMQVLVVSLFVHWSGIVCKWGGFVFCFCDGNGGVWTGEVEVFGILKWLKTWAFGLVFCFLMKGLFGYSVWIWIWCRNLIQIWKWEMKRRGWHMFMSCFSLITAMVVIVGSCVSWLDINMVRRFVWMSVLNQIGFGSLLLIQFSFSCSLMG